MRQRRTPLACSGGQALTQEAQGARGQDSRTAIFHPAAQNLYRRTPGPPSGKAGRRRPSLLEGRQKNRCASVPPGRRLLKQRVRCWARSAFGSSYRPLRRDHRALPGHSQSRSSPGRCGGDWLDRSQHWREGDCGGRYQMRTARRTRSAPLAQRAPTRPSEFLPFCAA